MFAFSPALARPGAPGRPVLSFRRRVAPAACATNDSAKGGDETLDTYRRGGRRLVNGDLLPFDVKVITPPPRKLGRFNLDARTHCGDVIQHEDTQFVVKNVTMHYNYGFNGRPVVVRKTAGVKSLARRAVEKHLERSLQ